jgi:hypothetical protein
MECHCSIDHRKIRAHFVSHHRGVKLPRDIDNTFANMLAKDYPTLVYPPRPPTQAVRPIYGLRKPLPSYRVCTNCHRGFKGVDHNDPKLNASKAFEKHVCVPGQPNPPKRAFFQSHVQAFEASTRSPFFPVLSPTPTVQPPNPWTSYLSAINSRPSRLQTMSVPDNYRVLDQFLQKEGWLAHVEGLDPVKLQALISLSQNDPLVPNLVKHCAAYMHHHQETLTSYYAKRLISTRPRCVIFKAPLNDLYR